MEDFLPGLVKVIEERLGFIGRPFTTVIVIFAGGGIIAWGANQIKAAIIDPFSNFVLGAPELHKLLVSALIGLGIWAIAMPIFLFALDRFYYNPKKKRLQEDVVRFHEETRSNLDEVKTTYAELGELYGEVKAHTAWAYDEIRRVCDEVGIPYPEGVENRKTPGDNVT